MTLEAKPRARDRRALRARRELAHAAVRLFEERGFTDTTVEEIADAADYSASTFFRHFATKEDAVFHDIPDRMQTYAPLLDDGLSTKALWKRAREILLENATYWQDADPDFALARTRLFHREPALYRRYLVHCDDIERLVTQAFATAHGRDIDTDVSSFVIGAGVVGAWRAGFAKWLASGGRLPEHIDEGLALIAPLARR